MRQYTRADAFTQKCVLYKTRYAEALHTQLFLPRARTQHGTPCWAHSQLHVLNFLIWLTTKLAVVSDSSPDFLAVSECAACATRLRQDFLHGVAFPHAFLMRETFTISKCALKAWVFDCLLADVHELLEVLGLGAACAAVTVGCAPARLRTTCSRQLARNVLGNAEHHDLQEFLEDVRRGTPSLPPQSPSS